MTQTVSSVILRTRDIVNKYRDWFEAVAAWYDCAKWTKRVFVDYLAVRNRPVGHVSLVLNDLIIEDRFRDRKSSEVLPLWWLPASLFKAGDNLLLVHFEPAGSAPLGIDGVTVEHNADLSEKTRHQLRPRPRPTTQASVAICLGTGYLPDADRWNTQADQKKVRFGLHFEGTVPAQFLLGLAVKLPTFGYSLILDDIWEFVEDAVRDKIKDLLLEQCRLLAQNDPRAAILEQQVRDLESYLELHHKHLARILPLSEQTTLDEVIEKARKSRQAELSPSAQQPILVKPISPPQIPGRPKAPARSHWFLRFLIAIFALAVTAGAVLFTAWYVGLLTPEKLPWLARAFDQKRPPQPNLPGGIRRLQLNRDPPNEKEREDLMQRLADRKAQSGDIQLSLFWFNKNDLDLEVVGPAGKIDFNTKDRFVGGGKLDVDMNVFYKDASTQPLENMVWPKGTAVKGHYAVYVNHFTNHRQPDSQDPTRFRLRVVVRNQEQWFSGELVHKDEPINDENRNRVLVHEFDFP